MYVFVGGTPAAGKSFTVKEFIKNSGLNIECVSLDDLREEFTKDPQRQWVDFFWNKNEEDYWQNTSYRKHSDNLSKQSEAFWPTVKEKIARVQNERKHAIFEGVNLLPHLVKEYTNIPTLFLIQRDSKIVLERIKKEPRWGEELHLQELEAKYFVEYDAKFIKEEAEKYGLTVFNDPQKLTEELKRLFNM